MAVGEGGWDGEGATQVACERLKPNGGPSVICGASTAPSSPISPITLPSNTWQCLDTKRTPLLNNLFFKGYSIPLPTLGGLGL